jgi:hypothetical protein
MIKTYYLVLKEIVDVRVQTTFFFHNLEMNVQDVCRCIVKPFRLDYKKN